MNQIALHLKYFLSLGLKKKFFRHPNCIVIGNYALLNRQLKYFKFNLKLKLINNSFKTKDLKGKAIPILNVKHNQKKIFEKISKKIK